MLGQIACSFNLFISTIYIIINLQSKTNSYYSLSAPGTNGSFFYESISQCVSRLRGGDAPYHDEVPWPKQVPSGSGSIWIHRSCHDPSNTSNTSNTSKLRCKLLWRFVKFHFRVIFLCSVLRSSFSLQPFMWTSVPIMLTASESTGDPTKFRHFTWGMCRIAAWCVMIQMEVSKVRFNILNDMTMIWVECNFFIYYQSIFPNMNWYVCGWQEYILWILHFVLKWYTSKSVLSTLEFSKSFKADDVHKGLHAKLMWIFLCSWNTFPCSLELRSIDAPPCPSMLRLRFGLRSKASTRRRVWEIARQNMRVRVLCLLCCQGRWPACGLVVSDKLRFGSLRCQNSWKRIVDLLGSGWRWTLHM